MPVLFKNSESGTKCTNIYYDLFVPLAGLILLFIFLPAISNAGHNVELIWTAPGDDFNFGQGSYYDIRYCSAPIESDTLEWWNSAIVAEDAPKPSPAGFKDSCVIRDLSLDSSYYFSIRTSDDAKNWSGISNIAEIPPIFCMDITGDDKINILDPVFLLNFIYGADAYAPEGTDGDVDNSGVVDILDALAIINFFYKSFPPPDCLE